jgi:hypothetical protein
MAPLGLRFALLPLLWVWISVGRWVGPGLALVGLLPPLVPFTLSSKRLLFYILLIFGACFCIHINSTGTSGNRSKTYVYVSIDVYFPPFWAYVGGINLSITTANSGVGARSFNIGGFTSQLPSVPPYRCRGRIPTII